MNKNQFELSETDEKRITDLLVGRRVVRAETGDWDIDYWDHPTGRLTLDDGTLVYVVPNQGGCACSAGDYSLEHLATVDNIITSVRVTEDDTDLDKYGEGPKRYQIFVVADATEINLLTVEGDDGNGYYGTGYRLVVFDA